MKPSDLFGVVVRAMGLILVLTALWKLLGAVVNLVGGGPGNVLAMVVSGVPALLVGLWLLRGAKALVSFAFPEESRHEGG